MKPGVRRHRRTPSALNQPDHRRVMRAADDEQAVVSSAHQTVKARTWPWLLVESRRAGSKADLAGGVDAQLGEALGLKALLLDQLLPPRHVLHLQVHLAHKKESAGRLRKDGGRPLRCYARKDQDPNASFYYFALNY